MMLRTFLVSVLFLAASGLFAQEGLNLDKIDEAMQATDSAPTSPAVPGESAVETKSDPDKAESTSKPKKQTTFFDLVLAGGWIGHVIILLSFVSVALMIEHALTISKKAMMPPGFADGVLQLLTQGQLHPAIQRCQDDPSVLARILYNGMKEYELGWDAVEKGAEEATAEQVSNLYRKIEYLNVIGNIAPMLGLLGTVVGMVFAFRQLAESEGFAKAADLAEGIYLALITTVEGLIVAIPSLAAYSYFGNRIASLITETTLVAEQVLHPIKKSFIRRNEAAGRKADAGSK